MVYELTYFVQTSLVQNFHWSNNNHKDKLSNIQSHQNYFQHNLCIILPYIILYTLYAHKTRYNIYIEKNCIFLKFNL